MGDYVDVIPYEFINYEFGPKSYIPVSGMSGIKFQIRTRHGVNLRCGGQDFQLEILFGHRIVMRLVEHDPISSELIDTDLLNNEWHDFWLTWHRGVVCLGKAGSSVPVMSKKVSDFTMMEVLEPDRRAHWKFEMRPKLDRVTLKRPASDLKWVANVDEPLPLDEAVCGGDEGAPLYVIRAMHSGALTPGNYNTLTNKACICWGGQAHEKPNFEILIGYNYRWVEATNGSVPYGALKAGHSETGEPLYISRVNKDGYRIVGKLHPSHRNAYIPYKSQEVASEKYEILVTRTDSRVKFHKTENSGLGALAGMEDMSSSEDSDEDY